MNLTLRILGNRISVHCSMPVQSSSFRFALLKTLTISQFRNNDIPVASVATEECQMEFRPPMKKYTFEGLEAGELSVAYEGSLSGWFLFMEEELRHFSVYNGWYPMGFDADESYDVTLMCDDSCTLLHGCYDADAACWRYQAKDPSFADCNILLYRPEACECFENEAVRILCFDPQSGAVAKAFLKSYSAIWRFYLDLYGQGAAARTSIVFMPQREGCDGAYMRDGLIVFGKLDVFGKADQSMDRMLHVLAHEMGHTYGTGADTESWEDWLNETHAEWSALLYQEAHNPTLFEQLVTELPKRYQRPVLTLRPDGDKRPQEVHTTGTLLYYGIYQRHGRRAIETLLTVFDKLPVKTTQHFLNALDEENATLADEIRACL